MLKVLESIGGGAIELMKLFASIISSAAEYFSGNRKALWVSMAVIGAAAATFPSPEKGFWFAVLVGSFTFGLYTVKAEWIDVVYSAIGLALMGYGTKYLIDPYYGRLFIALGVLLIPSAALFKYAAKLGRKEVQIMN